MFLLVDASQAILFKDHERVLVHCELPYDAGPFDAEAKVVWSRDGLLDRRGARVSGVDIQFSDLSVGLENALDLALTRHLSVVLVVGMEDSVFKELTKLAQRQVLLQKVGSTEEATEQLDQQEIAVLVCGEELRDLTAVAFLQQVSQTFPVLDTATIVLAAGAELDIFQELVDEDKVFYLTSQPVPPQELFDIIRGAEEHYLARFLSAAPPWRLHGESTTRKARRVLEASWQLAKEKDLPAVDKLAVETIKELVAAERAYQLFYDPKSEILWSKSEQGERIQSAAAGLVSFAARTGSPLCVAQVSTDPRYDREADDPHGQGDERLLVQPVPASTGRTLGLLVAVRSAAQLEFSRDDCDFLEMLALQMSAVLNQLSLQNEIEQAIESQASVWQDEDIYRKEALEYHSASKTEANLMDLSPAWTRWSYWIVLFVFIAALLYAILGQRHEYATGPAVVRFEGLFDITAVTPGTVTSVDVQEGQQVAPGDLLVRLYDAQELANLEKIRREFELLSIASLRDPTDESAKRTLGGLRVQRDLAESQLRFKEIRSPEAGIIGDIRVRRSQRLNPGETVLTITKKSRSMSIIALIPGHYRPQIKVDDLLRFELTGYPHAYQLLKVTSVSNEVIGPNEARRLLTPDVADSVVPDGSIVVVRAELPSTTFRANRRDYRYYDGMLGTADVRLRSESILFTLLPGLKAVTEGIDG
jgi:membrane fusion protein (multidrug efflux system)